jgi:hypothetical protein
MIVVMNPQGLINLGPWNLPEEFEEPNWTTLMNPSSQEILEARGLLGLGRVASGARAYPRLPWRRYAGNVDLY